MKFSSERMAQYLAFVEGRHNVWLERQVGAPAPWSSDPILASKKFTNVFRVLDPGSQFIFELGAERPEDTLLRLFLYRHTGRVEAWEYLPLSVGEYPTHDNLDEVLTAWKEYRGAVRKKKVLTRWSKTETWHLDSARTVFTNAYLVFPQSHEKGTDKLESILALTDRLFNKEGLAAQFLVAECQQERYKVLRANKGVGDFMSMQILTDWGYTRFGSDAENEFVVPGPGCRKGIMAITDTPKQVDFLHFAREEVLAGDDVPMLSLDNGEVRVPSIMDVQNTLCEFSKYVRYLGKGTTGLRPYQPAHPGQQPNPVLPAHWA